MERPGIPVKTRTVSENRMKNQMTWMRWPWKNSGLGVVGLLKGNNVRNSIGSFGLTRYHPGVW